MPASCIKACSVALISKEQQAAMVILPGCSELAYGCWQMQG
jgi:hypothetical protein